jgi:hypothetical protein
MPKATRAQQGERNLLQICLDVHMCSSDSSDATLDTYIEDIELLKKAVRHWEKGYVGTKAFDDAVLNLINATIDEANPDG